MVRQRTIIRLLLTGVASIADFIIERTVRFSDIVVSRAFIPDFLRKSAVILLLRWMCLGS